MKKTIKISIIISILLTTVVICLNKKAKTRRHIKMINNQKYDVQEKLKPSGLNGISDNQINDHWNLYKGYVTNVNKLNDELRLLEKEGKADSLIYADRRRRYGFEYNGMILHEYYFGNLTSKSEVLGNDPLKTEMEKTWGSFDKWLTDFINTGKSRSIGWAILFADTTTGKLTNNFIFEHGNGIVAGFAPILVMDVWEHAYMVDHKAGGRGDYMQSFVKNINWNIVKNRYKDVLEGKITKRF